MIRAEDNVILESQKSINDTANEAHTIASTTEQHFWMTETGDDTGAHITEKTKEAFLADPQNGGGNLLARSNGVAVRDGLTELATFSSNGLDVLINGISRAGFGEVARIGRTAPPHIEIDSTATRDGDDGYSVNSIIVKQGVRECGAVRLYANTYTNQNTPQELELEIDGADILSVYAHQNQAVSNIFVGDITSETKNVFVAINGDLEVYGNISANGGTINDFVTEQGTSGIWTYRKWKSGTLELWGTYTASIAITNSSASYGGYRSGQLNIPSFPFTFDSAPSITATVNSAGGAWVNNVVPTTTGGTFYLSAGASMASASRSIAFHVIGVIGE